MGKGCRCYFYPLLQVLGTERGAEHKAITSPCAFLLFSVLGWKNPVGVLSQATKMFFTHPVILTQTARFSCYLLHLLASSSSSLKSSWCHQTQNSRGSLWLHSVFCLLLLQAESCWFSNGEVEESNIKRMHFSCWSIWPGDRQSCGHPHWADGVCKVVTKAETLACWREITKEKCSSLCASLHLLPLILWPIRDGKKDIERIKSSTTFSWNWASTQF